jgi:hypothetical protein
MLWAVGRADQTIAALCRVAIDLPSNRQADDVQEGDVNL